MGVEPKIGGKPTKSWILIGVSMKQNHPFWGTPVFGNTYIEASHLYVENPSNLMTPWPKCEVYHLFHLAGNRLLIQQVARCGLQLAMIQRWELSFQEAKKTWKFNH